MILKKMLMKKIIIMHILKKYSLHTSIEKKMN